MGHLLGKKSDHCREVIIDQGSTVIHVADFCFLMHRLVLLMLFTFQRTKKQADKKAMVFFAFHMKSLYLIPLV